MDKFHKVTTDIKNKGFYNVDPNEIELISTIQSSGKYMLDLQPDKSRQWVIRKNPNYINLFWHDFKIAFIGAILTLLIGITLWLIDKQDKNQEIQQLKDRLDKIEKNANLSSKK